MLKSLETRLNEIKNLSIGNISSELAVSIPANYLAQFDDVIGTTLAKDSLVAIGDVKYLVMQDTIAQSHQRPDSEGMLAIYKPYREKGVYEWLYGEYCEIDDIRTYNDIRYTAIQDPGANIYSPDQVPAIWEVIKED